MGKYGFLLITSAIVVLYNTVEVSSQCQSIGCGDCYTWCAPVHCSYPTGQLYCRATCGSCPNEQCRAAGCSHTCNPNTNPVTCTCNAGYELQADGKTCLDINECERSSNLCTNPTSPRCKNTPGSYICTGCGADSNTVWQYYNRTECCKIDTASQCGTSSTTGGRIVGGELAVIANWPWSAYIKIGSTLCTGALIKRNVVLTAAHCLANRVTNLDELRIYLGVQNISDTGNIHSQHIAALRYVQHPNFDSSTLENDIAIIFLRTEATIGDYVNTICLPNGEQIAEGTKCWATGYGAISEGGPLSQTLRQVALPIANSQTCVQNYARISRTVNPVKTMCAGYEQGGRDSCQGDSGGPLVCQRCNSCNWFLAGLVSFGRGCARVGMFGIYSRMTYFEQWIASQTGMNHSPRSCVRPSWSNWSAWSQDCPSCGAGTRTKTRSCTNGVVGDPGCDGSATMTGSCPNNPCSSGSWGDYQQWSTCTVSCGGGTRTRTRSCNGGSVGSIGCPGEESQTEPCNTYNCPGWNNWGNWGECTASCGGGTREATRTCNTFGQAGATCSGDATKSEACNTTPCPTWGEWQWDSCSNTCGGGTRTGTRTCNKHGGTLECTGSATTSESCGNAACVGASWGDFGAWSACTASCNGGTRTRTRSCNQGSIGSNGCPSGGESELEPCNTFGCPTWNDMVWGDCSVTCGGGTRTGTRTCNRNGGTADCVGSNTVTGVCGAAQCATSSCVDTLGDCSDYSSLCSSLAHQSLLQSICPQTCGFCGSSTGSWDEWTNSGGCSLTCGGGTQQQTRTCTGGTAGAGGCPGSSTQTIACNQQACPPQGSWGGWSNSGTCSLTCGGGTQQQIRTCNGGTAGAGGCPGSSTQTIACNQQACPPQGSWGGWSNSGTCSLTCGGGTQQQIRTCNGGTAGAGGCPGSTTQTIACNGQACPSSGSWGGWINVGTCSTSCMQAQTRQCNGGTAGQGGCSGLSSRIQSCTGGACPTQTGSCSNLRDLQAPATCRNWASFNYCTNYAGYMLANCAKSCCERNAGASSTACSTIFDSFGTWCTATTLDCSNAYILYVCARTCNPLCSAAG
uniref:A disintegrin and metalloproteinase with thrombospondin motifs adt-1-like isoform X2 n=1 Tax=Ciona intestinalis TaxID=7719 RepID=UPI00089DBF19|nr:A disintegrin and metalloproteinase with thrombospondin motifs adt-1-like isoform X2 [Ciona intestinalis]|eukprot:XP_026692083.1 A disintegrin and metalloproteinase with thrombospondin motifs adt-1-like isoform X2 [Ciona intestinalis]